MHSTGKAQPVLLDLHPILDELFDDLLEDCLDPRGIWTRALEIELDLLNVDTKPARGKDQSPHRPRNL